jgi:hypothetical protein
MFNYNIFTAKQPTLGFNLKKILSFYIYPGVGIYTHL